MPVQFTASSGRLLAPLTPFALREFLDSLPADAEILIDVFDNGNQRDPEPEAYVFKATWSASPPARPTFPHHGPGIRSTLSRRSSASTTPPDESDGTIMAASCPDEHLPGTTCGSCGAYSPRFGEDMPASVTFTGEAEGHVTQPAPPDLPTAPRPKLDPDVYPAGSAERAALEAEIAAGRADRFVP